MKFGKNRVQYDEFQWTYYKFDNFRVFFYKGGGDLAVYTAKYAEGAIAQMQAKFDYYLDEGDRIEFIVYNKIDHFRQSNVGAGQDEDNNIGGITRIIGNKVFLYFEGDHRAFEKQIRAGIAEVIINQMMYGNNWKEMVKNATLLNLPEWYMKGIVSYSAEPWNTTIDNQIRDGVMSGRFDKFNRLIGKDAETAGHALWYYIAEVYGENVIPNILYMSRISRNIESGFLFVLGVSLNSITEESNSYYKRKYEYDERTKKLPPSTPLPIKSRENRVYQEIKLSPDGKKAAYVTNELGQVKVWIYDFELEKSKKIFKQNYKLDRITDYSNPLLGWHPNGKILTIINEKKGQINLTYYLLEEEKLESKPIFQLEKILDFDYADNGKEMVFSAIYKGQSDIYHYKIAPNVHKKITDDIFDDYHPLFTNNSSEIIFSSNRIDDTLKVDQTKTIPNNHTDLFIYKMNQKSKLLTRVTNTPKINETKPEPFLKNDFTFLSDKNGIINQYYAGVDSVISHIDTVIHYKSVTKSMPITNYPRNILSYHNAPKLKQQAQIILKNGKYNFYIDKLKANPESYRTDRDNSSFKSNEVKISNTTNDFKTPSIKNKIKVIYETVELPETQDPSKEVDIFDYQFEFEKESADLENQGDTRENIPQPLTEEKFIQQESDTNSAKSGEFKLPLQRNYYRAFAASGLTSQFDFDFANQIYQPFNGGPYVAPGLGTVLKINLTDLLEDYEIEGGIRYSWNNNNIEYFLSLDNRIKRLDKKYMLQRQSITSVSGFSVLKTHINQFKYQLTWPLNEVTSFRGTVNARIDRTITLSTDRTSLEVPDNIVNWGGLKFEYIFDNSLSRGLNLYNGSRAKVFVEHYRQITDAKTDITILGLDARHYQKIHRSFIWASRIAASTSFGNRKLIYYTGGVNNAISLDAKPKFDFSTSIADDQNFFWQTIATPIRGFLQNARNGNSFAVINSELRLPVFKYLLNKPIRSDFISNFQITGCMDVGTAWTGKSPFSNDNAFNTNIIERHPLKITTKNQQGPIIGGTGFGIRSRLWGYFIRLDFAWGIEDVEIAEKSVTHFSIGLDF